MSAAKLPANQSRIKKLKAMMVEQLKKNPITQAACEKVEIGRATHYRWISEDKTYAKNVDMAIAEGVALCNDLGESQILSAIQSGDLDAVKFFLRANHPRYKNKLEVSGTLKTEHELSTEQKAIIRKALKLSKLIPKTYEKE